MANKIDKLLLQMPEFEASDLHMVVGQKPKYRVHGEVTKLEDEPELTKQSMEEYLFPILNKEQLSYYKQHHDFDFAYGIPGKDRFRCNYFMQRTGYGAVFRIIPKDILTLEQLGMPEVLKKFCNLRSGLVLVTGPTGSGKSTTLAAMIDYINERQRRHIVTIEDPVEFVHNSKKCMISHREVGAHTKSFANALRSVSRQDADVVLVGEMRDMETIGLALSAAAMGVLVYGTLHTNNAMKTVDRIIDVFPADQQAQIRTMLSESLRGVVAQQLLKKKAGGRCAANEVLVGNSAVANLIREGKIESLISVLQSGKEEGMQLMDDVLFRLANDGTIDGRDAYGKANDKKRFERFISKAELDPAAA